MKTIALSNGLTCAVDDKDWVELGKSAWHHKPSKNPRLTGYAYRNVKRDGRGTTQKMHRLLMGEPPGMDVDHRDHNGLNNTRDNLRVATRSQNHRNRQKLPGNATSDYKGVSWDKARGRWTAHIKIGGKAKNLGRFEEELTAARVYDAAALRLFGSFALLNLSSDSL